MSGSRGGAGSVSREFDWADVRPSAAVLETVSASVGLSIETLGPLNDVIDPEALNDLFLCRDVVESLTVSFSYEDSHVTVCADGTVSVVEQ